MNNKLTSQQLSWVSSCRSLSSGKTSQGFESIAKSAASLSPFIFTSPLTPWMERSSNYKKTFKRSTKTRIKLFFIAVWRARHSLEHNAISIRWYTFYHLWSCTLTHQEIREFLCKTHQNLFFQIRQDLAFRLGFSSPRDGDRTNNN